MIKAFDNAKIIHCSNINYTNALNYLDYAPGDLI